MTLLCLGGIVVLIHRARGLRVVYVVVAALLRRYAVRILVPEGSAVIFQRWAAVIIASVAVLRASEGTRVPKRRKPESSLEKGLG